MSTLDRLHFMGAIEGRAFCNEGAAKALNLSAI